MKLDFLLPDPLVIAGELRTLTEACESAAAPQSGRNTTLLAAAELLEFMAAEIAALRDLADVVETKHAHDRLLEDIWMDQAKEAAGYPVDTPFPAVWDATLARAHGAMAETK